MLGMMEEPKGMKYWYIDERERWQIEDDAPEWAKKEFDEYMKSVNPEPDEDGIVTNY